MEHDSGFGNFVTVLLEKVGAKTERNAKIVVGPLAEVKKIRVKGACQQEDD